MSSYKKIFLKKLRIYLMNSSEKRTKYIIKHNIFGSVGDNFFFQPRKIPNDPKLIKFHNNVVVASNVTFINHDVMNKMLNNLNDGTFYKYYSGCTEIMDNVFIGSNTTILPNVKIGSNVIIGAGSVVTKDIPNNRVVAGNPAKEICTFEEFIEKRKQKENNIIEYYSDNLLEKIWEDFNNQRKEVR